MRKLCLLRAQLAYVHQDNGAKIGARKHARATSGPASLLEASVLDPYEIVQRNLAIALPSVCGGVLRVRLATSLTKDRGLGPSRPDRRSRLALATIYMAVLYLIW